MAAAILGNSGIQPDVLLTPGRSSAPALLEGGSPEPPAGTIFLQMGAGETPREVVHRPRRYGWPPTAALTPTCLGVSDEGTESLIGTR